MPISVQTVTIYDQPTGVGVTRLRCIATLVTDPALGQQASFDLQYVVVVKVSPDQLVQVSREDWMAVRGMRGMP